MMLAVVTCGYLEAAITSDQKRFLYTRISTEIELRRIFILAFDHHWKLLHEAEQLQIAYLCANLCAYNHCCNIECYWNC